VNKSLDASGLGFEGERREKKRLNDLRIQHTSTTDWSISSDETGSRWTFMRFLSVDRHLFRCQGRYLRHPS
jgi:hypothetical protein